MGGRWAWVAAWEVVLERGACGEAGVASAKGATARAAVAPTAAVWVGLLPRRPATRRRQAVPQPFRAGATSPRLAPGGPCRAWPWRMSQSGPPATCYGPMVVVTVKTILMLIAGAGPSLAPAGERRREEACVKACA